MSILQKARHTFTTYLKWSRLLRVWVPANRSSGQTALSPDIASCSLEPVSLWRGHWQSSSGGRTTGNRCYRTSFLACAVAAGFLSAVDGADDDVSWENEASCGDSDPGQQPIMVVQCAEAARPRPMSKQRQAAIQALDVIADVAHDTQPAVVSVTSADKGFFSRHTQSTGSGFIIDDAGHVITNAHVVGYRSNVFINLADGRSYPGRVLAVDVSSDLALIKLDVGSSVAKSLPQIPLAADVKSVRPGQFVLALGSPLMLANSVTVGVISAIDRDLGHSEGLKYIQTDAIITFGNSGGPLVNLMGEVIGVNAMVAGTGVGFAIPVDQVTRFAQLALHSSTSSSSGVVPGSAAGDSYVLTETPRDGCQQRRYLGLVMRTLTPELAFEMANRAGPQFLEVTDGVFIQAVMRNSPAQRAGLKAGDVIIAIDGLPITNAQQVYAATENREELTITIVRRGQRMTMAGVRTEKI